MLLRFTSPVLYPFTFGTSETTLPTPVQKHWVYTLCGCCRQLPQTIAGREQQNLQKMWGGTGWGVSAHGFVQGLHFIFNNSVQMYIIYIHVASIWARTHSGTSYCVFQISNSDFNIVRMKCIFYLRLISHLLYHIGFTLREVRKREENQPGRTCAGFGGGTICPNFWGSDDNQNTLRMLGETRERHWLVQNSEQRREEQK